MLALGASSSYTTTYSPYTRPSTGRLTLHTSLHYIKVGEQSFRHYDVITAKANHKLANTLPLRPGKDPNQAPYTREIVGIVYCNAGCGGNHVILDCQERRMCECYASTDHTWTASP